MSPPPPKPTIEDGLRAMERRWPEVFRQDHEDSPIFILSAGWRSGSTLLQRLLSERCLIWGEPYGHAWPIPSMADQVRFFTDRWPEPHHFYRGQPRESLATSFIANLYPGVGDLLHAHRGFFERLFAEPARAAGYDRWGLKEVRLDADHALYLRWVFPRARFLFLIRNPYDAWRSYAARAVRGWQWYNRWPDEPITARSFAAHWDRLVTSFLEGHRKVDGLLVRYEDLAAGRFAAIEEDLGFELSRQAARTNPGDGGPAPLAAIPEDDADAIEAELGPLAASLAYHLEASRSEAGGPSSGTRTRPRKDPSGCAVLVPYGWFIEPACEVGLRQLERRGYAVRRIPTDEGIALTRSQAASEALRDGFDELMWIDPDLEFDPDAVDRLRSLDRALACGVYPRRRTEGLAWNIAVEAEGIVRGRGDRPMEVACAEAGFLLSRREVYLAIQRQGELSPCRGRPGAPFFPFFLPLIAYEEGEARYLSEGFSFCVRARRCGFQILADPQLRPRSILTCAIGWEESGQ